MMQRDAGRGVNYAGVGSISTSVSRCISLALYCESGFTELHQAKYEHPSNEH